jgi:hypothetical protein
MSGLDDTSWTVRSVTGNTTLTNNDYVLLVSPGSATVVITVPDATTIQPGRNFIVRRDATATNVVQLARSGSNLINGSASNFAVGSAGAIGSAEIYSDGTNWFSLGTSV